MTCLAFLLALCFVDRSASAQAPGAVNSDQPEPLLCRPAGQGPFATVIWNHGLVSDRSTFTNAQRGWKSMCEAFAADGYLAYIPIRRFIANLGPADLRREADELAKVVLTAPARIPPRFLGDTLERVRSMQTPVLLMVENGDELGGLAAVQDIDTALKRRKKDDHRTIRYDRGGGHFLFVRKDYWWDDLKMFLDEKLKNLNNGNSKIRGT